MMQYPALFYNAERFEKEQIVECQLCPHNCKLKEGQSGICRVRNAHKGKLFTTNFSAVSSESSDPIEKKPLYHFHPGKMIYSVGTYGCNMQCPYCQNWRISQQKVQTIHLEPDELVARAKESGSFAIAYTYSEPIVWYEYVKACSKLAHEAGLKNVLVTNGFINEKPLQELLPHIDAANIDVKSFDESTYTKYQKAFLPDVMKSVEIAAKELHVELTTLIVTGMNDKPEELERMIKWIASVDPKIPWHISRYFPAYKYDKEATDLEFLESIYNEGKKRLRHVYCGNVAGKSEVHNTYCSKCDTLQIERSGYATRVVGLNGKVCIECEAEFDGII